MLKAQFFLLLKFTSRTLPTDAAGETHVLGEDGAALGVDGNEIGVLKKSSKVGFGGLLEGLDGGGLKTKFRTDVLGKLANEPLKRKLEKEKLCGLLVPPNLSEGDGAREVAVRLLDASS